MKKPNKLETIRERIIYFVDNFCKSRADFKENTGIKKGMFDPKDIDRAVGSDKLSKILGCYENLNLNWVVAGQGEMFIQDKQMAELKKYPIEEEVLGAKEQFFATYFTKTKQPKGVPFWDLAVSAGHSLDEIKGKRKADGYIIGLPGVDIAENMFPVTGMSMEPEISGAAIIGVRKIDIGETLNTERIYLIITHDDRMIKRIEHDSDNSEILWCVSPNYPKFKIYKSDILDIQRVCFVYNPK